MSEEKKILLVEDDDEFRNMVHELLKTENYQVVEAPCSEDALNLTKTDNFDLAITDLLMPGEGGFKFIRKMKAFDLNIKIIAMSGGSNETDVDECLFLAGRFRADVVMKKPFRKEELLQNIKALLND